MKWVFLKEFRDFIRSVLSEECDEDMMYFHILDCIEALTHIRTVGTTVNDEFFLGSKRRVFWQLVREVADRQKEIKKVDIVDCALSKVFRSFMSDTERSNDPSSWMPLHWAVLLPSTDIQDISQTLYTVLTTLCNWHV